MINGMEGQLSNVISKSNYLNISGYKIVMFLGGYDPLRL